GLANVVLVCTLIMSLAILAFTATDAFYLALPCVFVAGAMMTITGTGAQTLIQAAVDDRMSGRVICTLSHRRDQPPVATCRDALWQPGNWPDEFKCCETGELRCCRIRDDVVPKSARHPRAGCPLCRYPQRRGYPHHCRRS